MSAPRISAVLIALNEEANLPECLDSLRFCDEIVLVDGGSRDATIRIARERGVRVTERPFDDFASQKNHAMETATGDWLFFVDADERPTPELAREIVREISFGRRDAFRFPRKNRIFGRWMKNGANAADRPVRLVRKGKARFEGAVHERLVVSGSVGDLRSPLLHHSTPDVSAYMRKLIAYTRLESKTRRDRGDVFRESDLRKKPLLRFFQIAFLKKGLLDGVEGFFLCVFSAYYDFVSAAVRWEEEDRSRKSTKTDAHTL